MPTADYRWRGSQRLAKTQRLRRCYLRNLLVSNKLWLHPGVAAGIVMEKTEDG